jgi:hypothetical protein
LYIWKFRVFVCSFRFCKKQLSNICMYVNVIYFFVTRETFVHIVFELLAKKHLPVSHFTKKEIPLLLRQYWISRHGCCIVILLTKVPSLCKNISAKGISCVIGTFFHEPTRIFEGAIFLLLHCFCWCKMLYDAMLCSMIWWYDANDVYAQIIKEIPRLCIPLGTTLGSLHLLLRWYFSSASP